MAFMVLFTDLLMDHRTAIHTVLLMVILDPTLIFHNMDLIKGHLIGLPLIIWEDLAIVVLPHQDIYHALCTQAAPLLHLLVVLVHLLLGVLPWLWDRLHMFPLQEDRYLWIIDPHLHDQSFFKDHLHMEHRLPAITTFLLIMWDLLLLM